MRADRPGAATTAPGSAPMPEPSSSGIPALAPQANTAATAANTTVVSSIRVLVMPYMPRLLDRSSLWRA
jgi:hypothetical protein